MANRIPSRITGLLEKMAAMGYPRFMDYARARPSSTFDQLAKELEASTGIRVVPIEVKRLVLDEATSDAELTATAADALVRIIREIIPEGWSAGEAGAFPKSHTFGVWNAFFPPRYDDLLWRIFRRLKAAPIPDGWLPTGPDDPYIRAAFAGEEFRMPED
jgi:hypothetical protein